MLKKKLSCIICPKGCSISVQVEGKKIIEIKGNTCHRGEEYAFEELTNPVRTVTTTVRVKGVGDKVLPVKTDRPIKKEKILSLMEFLASVEVVLPVHVGDIVATNPLGTNLNIVATKTITTLRINV